MPFNNFNEALDYLYSFINYETRRQANYNPENYNLKRMKLFLKKLNVKEHGKIIHIAGTKGKGSTANYALNILKKAKIKCGLFTSPHIESVCERIQINGKMISKAKMKKLIEICQKAVDKTEKEMRPTTFELFTAIALKHFENEKTDCAIIETGMGGRLDSTNIVYPNLTIITEISYDHMDKLGKTLSKIAYEKAGIIKKGVPLVLAKQKAFARKVIFERAKEENAKVYEYGESFFAKRLSENPVDVSFQYAEKSENLLIDMKTQMFGFHQTENASLAIKAIRLLYPKIDLSSIQKGIYKTKLKGRLEKISESPTLFLDGAHNGASLEKVLNYLSKRYGKKLCVLFAPLKDKDIKRMSNTLAKYKLKIIISNVNTHKETDIKETGIFLKEKGLQFEEIKDFKKAFEKTKSYAKRNDCVGIITGSLYAVSTYYEMIKEKD